MGRVFDPITQAGIPNVKVSSYWEYTGSWFTDLKAIQAVQTDINGYFKFNKLMDTSLLAEEYSLRVSVPILKDYLIKNDRFSFRRISLLDTLNRALNFEFYPLCSLTVELTYNPKDSLYKYTIQDKSAYHRGNETIHLVDPFRETQTTNSINIYTLANVSNSIECIRYNRKGIQSFRDTIICHKDQRNVIKFKL